MFETGCQTEDPEFGLPHGDYRSPFQRAVRARVAKNIELDAKKVLGSWCTLQSFPRKNLRV